MTYKIDPLTLLSGIDIPVQELQVNIHQPTIKEIAYIGEENFYKAAYAITTSGKKTVERLQDLDDEEKATLLAKSNFEIFSLMISSDKNRLLENSVLCLLTLLFPTHQINIQERFIFLVDTSAKKQIIIDDNNFDTLQEIISTIFRLNSSATNEDFNPVGDRAREIAEKIKKGREKIAKQKGEQGQNTSVLSRYISALGIASQALNIINILELTLYQLLNQFERYKLYSEYETAIKLKLAGSKDVEIVDWLQDIDNKNN